MVCDLYPNISAKKVSQLKKFWVLPTNWCVCQLHAHHTHYRYFKNWKQILHTGYPTFPPKYVLGLYFDQSTVVDAVEIQRWIRHVPFFEKLTIWLLPSACHHCQISRDIYLGSLVQIIAFTSKNPAGHKRGTVNPWASGRSEISSQRTGIRLLWWSSG